MDNGVRDAIRAAAVEVVAREAARDPRNQAYFARTGPFGCGCAQQQEAALDADPEDETVDDLA